MGSPRLLCCNKNWKISVDSLPFRFHENPFRCCRVITCGLADMEKLIGASLLLPRPPKRDKEVLRICTQISVPNSHVRVQECCFLFTLTKIRNRIELNYVTTQHFLKIRISSVFCPKYLLFSYFFRQSVLVRFIRSHGDVFGELLASNGLVCCSGTVNYRTVA
jgi:hypothetical protein